MKTGYHVDLFSVKMQGCVVRVQGDEVWHMTKVLRLGLNDRYHFPLNS